jgi:predicted nucleotidyltransferase
VSASLTLFPSGGVKLGSDSNSPYQAIPAIAADLTDVLARFPQLVLALVFGSVAQGSERPDSDLDIAVAATQPLTVAEHIAIINALAERTGRPIDLIDLKTVGLPLLGQIVRHGRRLLGSDTAYAQMVSRYLIDAADFMPLHNRILTERRAAWIG